VALPNFLTAFSFRNFRLLWIGAFLSSVGTWTQDVALAWLIHVRFADPFYLGLRAFASDAPLITFMLVGGAVADRVDRRRILLTSQILQMLFAATLGVLYALGRLGIETMAPEAPDFETVDHIIFAELVDGIFTDASREAYNRVIVRLRDRGCDAVALACTEIPLLVTPEVSPLPTLDSTRLLARAAFDVAVGAQPIPTWRGGPAKS